MESGVRSELLHIEWRKAYLQRHVTWAAMVNCGLEHGLLHARYAREVQHPRQLAERSGKYF
jgi:hypothetical protein